MYFFIKQKLRNLILTQKIKKVKDAFIMFLISNKKQKILIFRPSDNCSRIEVYANVGDIPFRNCYVFNAKSISAYEDKGKYYCNNVIISNYVGEIKEFSFFEEKI